MRTLLVVAAFLAYTALAAAPTRCPATASASHKLFVPPTPYRAALERGHFWFGSEKLWVALRDDGHWGGVRVADPNVSRNKLALYRAGFDWTRDSKPAMVVTARYVNDVSGLGPIVSETTHAVSDDTNSFMMTALDLPAGCWQIAAQYASESPLTFVVYAP